MSEYISPNNKIAFVREDAQDFSFSEAFKTLRTNLLFCGSNIKVIDFTSSVTHEGKTTVAVEAARAFAGIGKRVLFIDADIRGSKLSAACNVTSGVCGLSQYLSGQAALSEIICGTDVEGLDLILSGPAAPNPAELLEEQLFAKLIGYAREHYDYVVIDTPPLGSTIDPAIVAKQCDGAVIVVAGGEISYRLAVSVKEQLEISGCRILGVVLNKLDIQGTRYYGKYGRYGYGKYGRYGYGKEAE